MKNPLLVYTVARIGVFAGVLAILLVIGFAPIVATVIATMLSFSFSLIFLRKPREASSALIAERLQKKTDDETAED
jgi:phosphate/sulfate permease